MPSHRIPGGSCLGRRILQVPGASLPCDDEMAPAVTLWQPAHGGHVGFAQGGWPGHVRALPEAVAAWLADHAALG